MCYPTIVYTAGMSRALKAELARRVTAEQPGVEHAVLHDGTIAGSHPFTVKWRRGQSFAQMRSLLNGEPIGQNGLTKRIEQESRLTIHITAADGPDEMAKQFGGNFGGKQYRRLHGRQFTWIRCASVRRAHSSPTHCGERKSPKARPRV